MIDEAEADRGEVTIAAVDFGRLVLPVIEADAAEAAAHAALLAELDKASGGKTLWPRPAEAAAPAVA